jgi:hypothetical protein
MATQLFGDPNNTKGADYSILPKPIQQALARAKLVQGASHSTYSGLSDIATVDEGSTDTITVRDPARFQPQVKAHEATHLWQHSLPKSIQDQFGKTDPNDAYLDPKNLVSSITTMRAKGMKLENLPPEHQAELVQAMMMYHGDKEYKTALQPWMEDVTRLDNAAQLERLLHAPVLPSGKNVSALYNAQKGN